MSDCFKESDRSNDVSEQHSSARIARDQWREKSTGCKQSDTASAHLPELSISDQQGGDKTRHQHHHHSKQLGDAGANSISFPTINDGTIFGGAQANASSDRQSVLNTLPSDGTQITDSNFGGVTNPSDALTAAVPNTNISDLTQISEQLLPVHSNGSYPSTTDWEGLHSANVQKAANAAQSGSNLEFFGDSITEAMGWNPAAMQPFNDAFGADKPTALGLGGDGTAQLLYRLNHGEMQGQPKAAVVMIGTNDLGSLSAAQIAENTKKSIESIQLRSPNTKVVVMGIVPRPDDSDPGNTMVDAANEALSNLATADGGVQFVNLRDSFVDGNGNERPELYQSDKLHLSPAGYQVWADGIREALARDLSAPNAPSGDNSSIRRDNHRHPDLMVFMFHRDNHRHPDLMVFMFHRDNHRHPDLMVFMFHQVNHRLEPTMLTIHRANLHRVPTPRTRLWRNPPALLLSIPQEFAA